MTTATESIDQAELLKCMRCGLCQAVCPIYRETGLETHVARGLVQMIRAAEEGRLPLSERYEHYIYNCLTCMACVASCPSGVVTDRLVFSARERLTRAKGSPFIKRFMLRRFLRSPRMLGLAAWGVGFYQHTGLRRLAHRLGVLRLLPYGLGAREAILPPTHSKFSVKRLYGTTPARGEKRARVAYFLGCANKIVFPEVARAAVEVLAENGCEVVVPGSLQCCGMPHFGYGEKDALLAAARHNKQLFVAAKVEAIVTDCASCGAALKEYDELLAGANGEPGLGIPVYDIATYLLDVIGLKPPTGRVEAVVTYHDPCHLVRSMGVSSAPRQLMQSIPGMQLSEMKEANWCCGGAGTYNITHPEMSQRILARKIDHIEETGAGVVATECPGCQLQIGFGLRQRHPHARVVNPVELLWTAYQRGKDS